MRFFFLLLVVSAVLVGCGDGSKLSRSKAADMIQNNVLFNTLTDKIIVGDYWGAYGLLENSQGETLSKLAQRDVVTYQKQSGGWELYAVALTTKGRQFLIKEKKPDGGGGMIAVLKLCDRKINDVTGIEQPTPQSAVVSFTYNTTNPTPFGEMAPKRCSAETREGVAELKLFDDGWRVERVDFRHENDHMEVYLME